MNVSRRLKLPKMHNSATTFNYGRGAHSQHPGSPSSPNGAVKRPSGIVVGGGKGKNGTLDREKYHLLNLSDSEINDSAEDLKLPSPSATGGALITTLNTSYKTPAGAITNSVPTAAGRIRRKIRLKR